MSSPRVSIGVPVYNGADTLAEAFDSLLAQTFTDFEVLISDNASTDATQAICQSYAARDGRFKYERNAENLGAAGNFNRVCDRASGDYFKWFAADDLLAPEYLERCVAALDEAGDEFVLAFPGRKIVDPDGKPLDSDPYLISGKPSDEQTFDDIDFARLMRVCGSRCPIFVFGLMRTYAARWTQGMGAFIAADLVYVAELRLRGRFRKVDGNLYLQRLHPPKPDVLARTRRAGDAAWFDTKKRSRWVFPEWRLLSEMIRAIRRAPVSRKVRFSAYASLFGHIFTRGHRWIVLYGRRMRGQFWQLWSRLSCSIVAAERVTTIPLRLWMFAAGCKRLNSTQIAQAFSGPWGKANHALLQFAADKLGSRDEANAVNQLMIWLIGPFGLKQKLGAQKLDARRGAVAIRVADWLLRRGMSADRALSPIREQLGEESARAWEGELRKWMPPESFHSRVQSPTVCRVAS